MQPFKLVSREVKPDDTVVEAGTLRVGGGVVSVLARAVRRGKQNTVA